MRPIRTLAAALLIGAGALPASPALAQAQISMPGDALPRRAPIPVRDVPYSGTMTVEIDATDTLRNIVKVKQTIPVAGPGRLTLRYPQWLPGNHGPTGPLEAIAGLTFTAGDRVLTWRRNPEDVYAFDIEVPASVRSLDARFDYITDTPGAIGRTEMTPDMVNLQF